MDSNKKPLWFMKNTPEETAELYKDLPEPRPGMNKWSFGWNVMRPLRFGFLLSFLILVVGEVVSIATLYGVKVIVDMLSQAGVQMAAFVLPVGVLAGLYILQHASFRIVGWMQSRLLPLFGQRIELVLFRYATKHTPSYYAKHFSGALANKVRNVSDGFYGILETILYHFLDAVILIGGAVAIFWSLDLLFVGVLLVWVLFFIGIYSLLGPKRRLYSKKVSARMSAQTGQLVDSFTNSFAMTLFAQRRNEITRLESILYETFDTKRASWRFNEYMLLLINIVSLSARFGLLGLAIWFCVEGKATVGDVLLVTGLVDRLNHVLRTIGNVLNRFFSSLGSIDEGLEALVVHYDIEDKPNALPIRITEGKIVFESVNFAYPDRTPLFSNFSLTIQPGEKVGLVGRSGAGKSTLMSLLLRFHDVQSGTISIDGQDIAKSTQESLSEQIAMVPQEPILFHRSIMDNIRYGQQNATDEDVIRAASSALAHEFIMQLPEGYDTRVGERGVKLSGGQRQRIIIARAMLKSARILVLDEATSSLDSESEGAISDALHTLVQDKTVLAIAHRLSTLREMTRLLVLDGGRIVEDGTHEELLAKNGVYAGLWRTQAGGFIPE